MHEIDVERPRALSIDGDCTLDPLKDVLNVSSVLKLYFRMLPESLIPEFMYDDLLATQSMYRGGGEIFTL